MNSVVGLFKPVALWRPDEVVDDPWMPQEAPLVMPRQPLGRDEGPELGRTPATSPTDVNLRRACRVAPFPPLPFPPERHA